MAESFTLRVCFRKMGRLRHLSHLEVARACERAARRAALPYAVSAGFTPRMRLAFGPALPVGTAGEREYLDLVLTRFLPPAEACAALASVTVEELSPVACAYVSGKERSLAAALTIAEYDVHLEGGISHEGLERRIHAFVRTGTLSVEHKGKQKVYDLAEALPKEPLVVSCEDRILIRMAVRMSERGSLRPDVFVAAALGPEVHAAVTRTDLLIEDQGVWRRPL
ncbi:MAG: TIGR03936 family radical SAM-associated protein [Coriobacteriia bacterium]